MLLCSALIADSISSAKQHIAPPGPPCRGHKVKAPAIRHFAGQVWALDRWERGRPPRRTIGAYRHMLRCSAGPGHRKAGKKQWRRVRHRYGRYRLYRQVTPFEGPCNGAPIGPADGCHWAIPWEVVCGESGGDFYVNADGAYQIIPSTWAGAGGTRYAPTAGEATPLQQHIIAHALWGTTPWYGLCA